MDQTFKSLNNKPHSFMVIEVQFIHGNLRQ